VNRTRPAGAQVVPAANRVTGPDRRRRAVI